MKLEVRLPTYIEVRDYHEFEEAEEHYQLLNDKINVTEIGYGCNKYVGIIYLKEDKAFRKLKKELFEMFEIEDE